MRWSPTSYARRIGKTALTRLAPILLLIVSSSGKVGHASDAEVPTSPTLTAIAADPTDVSLTWTDESGASFYQVFRDGIVLLEDQIPTAYVDDAVEPSMTYSYFVIACNGRGCSDNSNTVTVTTADSLDVDVCSGITITPTDDIQAVIDDNPGGTTFCIRAGTYRLQGSVIPKSSDVLWGDPGAVLSGSKVVAFTKSGNYWYSSGQTQQAAKDTDTCLDANYTGCQYPEGVYFDDVSLWQVTSLSELSSGEFYFDYAADKIYLADDPTGHKVEASYVPEAIRGYGSSQTNVTIRGLIVEKFANTQTDQPAAIYTGTNWLVQDNEVRLNHGGGIKADSGSTILRNDVHDNGKYGVSTAFATNVLFEDDEIARNDAERFSFWNAGGSKFWTSTNITLRGNYVHDNTGHGLWSDGDSIYITYDSNIIENNTGCGILHEVSYDATVSNNLIRFNNTANVGLTLWYGSQIQVYDSPNVDIYGNFVETLPDTHGIGLRDDDRGSGLYGLYEIRNVTVHDNIIKLASGSQAGMVGTRNPNIYTSMGNQFTDNAYYVPDLLGKSWDWDGLVTWVTWQISGNDLAGKLRLW
jgi:hypothetical protein